MGIDLCTSHPESCSGCGACACICPSNAITMVYASNGFLYPEINIQDCTQCGLCLKVCDFKQFVPSKEEPSCYAVRHKDPEELRTSRSGGFFMALSKWVIEHRGVVFGCELNDQLQVVHRYRETYEESKKFKGSKYVQSDLGNTFEECATFLRSGRWVLFSGTGCQIHGLLRFLTMARVPTDTLFTVDIVCHGAPSPGVWETYTKLLEEKEKCRIKTVDFRDKATHGWTDHVEMYVLENGEKKYSRNWTAVFYRHILFRESCHVCKYTTIERKSDFTIGDYWGIGRNVPEFDDNCGCSLVLIHSCKGKKIFETLCDDIVSVETNWKTSMQPQLERPVWKGWDRTFFWKWFQKNRKQAVATWFFPSPITRGIWRIERMTKNIIKQFLGRK